ncbi:MAG: hypothetical protein U1C66_00575 [Patescibacteria group bacterium]|nr:hypothetical protein [Patescibacteria group bacterium]
MLLDRKRFGLILRVFSKTPEQVEKNANQTAKAARAAAALMVGGKFVFSEIQVLVAADKSRIDYDCGETSPLLREMLKDVPSAEVHEMQNGDLFCGVLNYGVASLVRKRCDFVGVLSHGALEYLTAENMAKVFEAFEAGARAVGLALDELQPSILEGRLANTAAFWDAVALMAVGGFDLRAAQPKRDEPSPYMRGWSEEKGEVFYPLAGVEEILALLRLAQTYGPCIAPIMPVGAPEWKVPDPATDPEGHSRHIKKMGTKWERQASFATSIGAELSCLKGGVMERYRTC